MGPLPVIVVSLFAVYLFLWLWDQLRHVTAKQQLKHFLLKNPRIDHQKNKWRHKRFCILLLREHRVLRLFFGYPWEEMWGSILCRSSHYLRAQHTCRSGQISNTSLPTSLHFSKLNTGVKMTGMRLLSRTCHSLGSIPRECKLTGNCWLKLGEAKVIYRSNQCDSVDLTLLPMEVTSSRNVVPFQTCGKLCVGIAPADPRRLKSRLKIPGRFSSWDSRMAGSS